MNVITVLHTKEGFSAMAAVEIYDRQVSITRVAIEEYYAVSKSIPVGYCITSFDQWFCEESELKECDKHMEEE